MCVSSRYLRVSGGVIGAAARTGHHDARRRGAQARAEFGELRGVARQLRGHHARSFGSLPEHPRGVHVLALSSATKS